MILTLTMNPAVDKSTSVDALIPEKKLRCSNVVTEAGGGGINVSKAIKKLGGESIALFPSGGNNGKLLEKYLQELDINFQTIPFEGETRESFAVSEEKTGSQFRFVLPGESLTEEQVKSSLDFVRNMDPRPEYVVASGSLPPGVPEDYFQQLAVICHERESKLIIDTSGLPLQLAVKEGVYLLKPNLNELATLAGKSSLELNEVDDAALELIRAGKCEVMIVSLGASGALLVTRDGYEHFPAPSVKKQTTVGAGDSMVAGMTYKLSQGADMRDVVRFGIACGTAATMNRGTQLFNPSDVEKLYDWMIKHSEKYRLNLD